MAEKMLMTQALVEELVTQNKILLAKKNISEATWKHNDAIIMEAYTKKLPIPELLTQDPTELGSPQDVNIAGMRKATALCQACWNKNQTDVKQILLECSPNDVNRFSEKGQTALYCACAQGSCEIALLLLNQFPGLAINSKMPPGTHESTALHGAACSGHQAIVALLLLSGADPTIKNSMGCTAYEECHLKYPKMKPIFQNFENQDIRTIFSKFPDLRGLERPAPKYKPLIENLPTPIIHPAHKKIRSSLEIYSLEIVCCESLQVKASSSAFCCTLASGKVKYETKSNIKPEWNEVFSVPRIEELTISCWEFDDKKDKKLLGELTFPKKHLQPCQGSSFALKSKTDQKLHIILSIT